jgi:hypothetical protein
MDYMQLMQALRGGGGPDQNASFGFKGFGGGGSSPWQSLFQNQAPGQASGGMMGAQSPGTGFISPPRMGQSTGSSMGSMPPQVQPPIMGTGSMPPQVQPQPGVSPVTAPGTMGTNMNFNTPPLLGAGGGMGSGAMTGGMSMNAAGKPGSN